MGPPSPLRLSSLFQPNGGGGGGGDARGVPTAGVHATSLSVRSSPKCPQHKPFGRFRIGSSGGLESCGGAAASASGDGAPTPSASSSSSGCGSPLPRPLMRNRTHSAFFLPAPPARLLLLPDPETTPCTPHAPPPAFVVECLRIGMYCEKGSRDSNEDMAFAMSLDPECHPAAGFRRAACLGVFDGHGGVE
eukprot:264928-Chlamydomonas_euryale.AAC.1